MSLGTGFAALAADATPVAHRGLGTSIFRSFGDVGFVLAPPLLGLLADQTSIHFAMQTLAFGSFGAGLALWHTNAGLAKLPASRA